MKLRKTPTNQSTSKEILDQASKCKPEELQELLNQVQIKIEKSNKNVNPDLLRAKTIITRRLASMRN